MKGRKHVNKEQKRSQKCIKSIFSLPNRSWNGMQGHPCWGDYHPPPGVGVFSLVPALHFPVGRIRGLEVRKFAHLLGTEGNPLLQLVCMSACKTVQLMKVEGNKEKPPGFSALIYTAAVLKIGVTSPERPDNVSFRTDICIRDALDRLTSHTLCCQANHKTLNLPQISANNFLRRMKSLSSKAPGSGERMKSPEHLKQN